MTGGRMIMARGCNPPDPGISRCTNATLKMLLTQAYEVKNYQIEGPAWLDSEGYDINAQIPEGGEKDVPLMLQNLLAERFQVKLHKEEKPLPIYELAVAKAGFKLKELDPEELKKEAEQNQGAGRGEPKVVPLPPPPPPGAGGGGGNVMMYVMAGGSDGAGKSVGIPGTGARMTMSGNGATTVSGKMTIAQLVGVISRAVDRPILDSTALKGFYDISLTYLADNSPMMSQMKGM